LHSKVGTGASQWSFACGHQLRKHSVISWKQVATFEATRLFLRDLAANGVDLSWNDEMGKYQQIANQAAIEERYSRAYKQEVAFEKRTIDIHA
jgi:hypothetical protein